MWNSLTIQLTRHRNLKFKWQRNRTRRISRQASSQTWVVGRKKWKAHTPWTNLISKMKLRRGKLSPKRIKRYIIKSRVSKTRHFRRKIRSLSLRKKKSRQNQTLYIQAGFLRQTFLIKIWSLLLLQKHPLTCLRMHSVKCLNYSEIRSLRPSSLGFLLVRAGHQPKLRSSIISL